MKILFWLSGSFDRRTPSEHLLSAMIAAMQGQGHEVCVLQKDTGGEKDPLPAEVRLPGVTTTRIPCGMPKKSRLISRYLTDLLYVWRCRRWLRKHREFDRVFLQSSNVAGAQVFVLKRLLKHAPVIYNVQDIFPENAMYSGKLRQGSLAFRGLSAVQKYAYRHADRVVTISEDMQRELLRIGVAEEKLSVIYNWSYGDKPYGPADCDTQAVSHIFTPGGYHVVYAGNIGVVQNVEVVVRAAALLRQEKDIRFHIIGDGAYREKLEQLAKELGADNLTFHDMLPSSLAPSLYAAADVNIIPLAKDIYRTALPSKTATCLACGKPIVFAFGAESLFGQEISRLTGCPVVDSDDAEGLCRAILRLRSGETVCRTEEAFLQRFLKSENSAAYAAVITQE